LIFVLTIHHGVDWGLRNSTTITLKAAEDGKTATNESGANLDQRRRGQKQREPLG
jgi:hypothetical protein